MLGTLVVFEEVIRPLPSCALHEVLGQGGGAEKDGEEWEGQAERGWEKQNVGGESRAWERDQVGLREGERGVCWMKQPGRRAGESDIVLRKI